MCSTGLLEEQGRILSNSYLGRNLYLLTVESPELARLMEPGQFVHTLIPGMEGHILRRPFSVYATDTQAGTMDILYQTVGFGTAHLASLEAGEVISNIGPIGHGWRAPDGCKRALIVCGGVGAAPLFMHTQALIDAGIEVDVVLGAQTAEAMVCADRYRKILGKDPVIATDDGSLGFSGFCTVPAQELLSANSYDYLCCCGPEPLMRIVARMAAEAGVYCQISMEKRMACGVGACLSCVIDTSCGKQRCCVDGPVFNAEEVIW